MKKIDNLSNKFDREISSLKRYFDEKLSILYAKLDNILEKKLKYVSYDFIEVVDDENLNVDGGVVDANDVEKDDVALDKNLKVDEEKKKSEDLLFFGVSKI